MSLNLRGNWNYPTTIWAGPGRIAELALACAKTGIKRPLIVTDEGLAGAPMIKNALAALKDAALFSAVRGNPALSHVEAGLRTYVKGAHDGVVAFGGGSIPESGPAGRRPGCLLWAMYGRRPRCKRSLTFERSVRVQPCIRPLNAAVLAAGPDVIR